MNKKLERKLNTWAYIITIIVEIIYIYVTNNEDKISNEEQNNLVRLGRFLLFIVALYFIINAIIGLRVEYNESQRKQVSAASLAFIAAIIRLTITSDDINFR